MASRVSGAISNIGFITIVEYQKSISIYIWVKLRSVSIIATKTFTP